MKVNKQITRALDRTTAVQKGAHEWMMELVCPIKFQTLDSAESIAMGILIKSTAYFYSKRPAFSAYEVCPDHGTPRRGLQGRVE